MKAINILIIYDFTFNNEYLITLRKSIPISSTLLIILSFLYFTPTNNVHAASYLPPCNLVLGWHFWPPLQYLNEANQPIGLQINLIKKLEAATNCQIQLRQQSFKKSQQDIKSGDIDLTFDITITEKRQKFGHFSIPYRKELLVLYVRPDYYQQCHEQDLTSLIKQGFRLSLTRGVNYGTKISNIQKDPKLNQLLYYQDDSKVELDLFKRNQLDGILEDPIVMAYMKRKDLQLALVESCQITVYEGLVSIMFSKKTVSNEIVKRFNKAINQLKQSADYQNLWGL